jgi:hypothetical protein
MSDEIDPASPEAAPDAAQSEPASAIEQVIERWWQDHFPGSPVARDTQAWNVAYAAKEALKRLLRGSI